MLALVAAIAILFFFVTSLAVASYHAKESQLARDWEAKGHAFLRAAQPARAVEAFQTALHYDPAAQDLRYAMVDSLLAAGRSEQARSYLLGLWDRQPANGVINLDLARIAASRSEVAAATRYYHNAIYGVWDSAAPEHRTAARLELITLLLRHNAQREADAELLALAANASASPELSRKVGNLFLQAGDQDNAFHQFAAALKSAPDDPELLAGAGKAAFYQARYALALGFLHKAGTAGDPETERLRELTRLIVESDPLDRDVSWQVRSRRTLAALAQADARMQQCAAQLSSSPEGVPASVGDVLTRLAEARKHAHAAALRRDPDLLLSISALAFSAEETAARYCGPPQGLDEALLLIGRQHPEARP